MPGSICFLHSMQVNVQINSLIASMKVCREMTLDLGSGCCVEATVISSFSVVMTVSKLDVTLSWLLKVDSTTFCRLRTSPSLNSIFSARSLHKTSSMCPVLSARSMLLFVLLSGYVPTKVASPILVTFAFRLINLMLSVSCLSIWDMLKVWSVISSCDVALETLVSRSSSSSRVLELPNAFLSLNDSRSYVTFDSKFKNMSLLKQTALIVDDGSLSHRFKENIEPFLMGLSGLLLRTAHVSFFEHL